MKKLISITAILILVAASVVQGATVRQTTLQGNAIYGSDTLAMCRVTVTLAGAKTFYTSSTVVPSYSEVTFADANGDFSVVVWGTDSLFAFPGGTPTYTLKYEHPILQPGGKFEVSGLSIAANGSTTEFRAVLAQ